MEHLVTDNVTLHLAKTPRSQATAANYRLRLPPTTEAGKPFMPYAILAAGIVLVPVILAWRCPEDKIPELARALARWLGHPR